MAKELADFDNLKETEKKKLEEEKRRIKRDKMLLEKGKKQQLKGRKYVLFILEANFLCFITGCEECVEKSKQVDMLTKELKTKEVKWAEEVNKLKDQLKKCDLKHKELKNENQHLRLNKVSSKLQLGRETGKEVGPEVVVKKHTEEKDLGYEGHASR